MSYCCHSASEGWDCDCRETELIDDNSKLKKELQCFKSLLLEKEKEIAGLKSIVKLCGAGNAPLIDLAKKLIKIERTYTVSYYLGDMNGVNDRIKKNIEECEKLQKDELYLELVKDTKE